MLRRSLAGWWSRPVTTTRKQLLRGFLAAIVLFLVLAGTAYVFRAPLLTWIGGQLIHEDPLTPADAIVVLSGGVPGRELEAADLYRERLAPRIVLPHDPESPAIAELQARGIKVEGELDLRKRIFRELGVPDQSVVVLPPVIESTDQEARLVLDWARSNRAASIIVVTSSFHTGRARLVYRRFAPSGVRVTVRAVRSDSYTPATWWLSRANLRNGLIEWQKQLLYRVLY